MRDITTKEFLDAIFENVPDDEIVCVTRDFVAFDWEAPEFVDRNLRSGASWHFCISTLKAEARGPDKLSRGAKDVAATYVIVLDDVGTKAAEPPVAPSYRLETSPDNFHWGYFLDPCEDAARVDAVMRALGALGFSDPAARGANRLMRFPGSKKNGFEAVLHEWEPHRFWSLDELMTAFGIDEADLEVKPVVAAAGGFVPEGMTDPLLIWQANAGRVVKDDGGAWAEVICPWCEWHGGGSNTASYSPLGRGEAPHLRGFKCFHEHSGQPEGDEQTFDTPAFLRWVVEQGGPDLPMNGAVEVLQRRYRLFSDCDDVVDIGALGTGHEFFPFRNFRRRTAVAAQRVPRAGVRGQPPYAYNVFQDHEDTVRYSGRTYRPDWPDVVDVPVVDGVTLFNTFCPPQHAEEEAGDAEVLAFGLAHIRWLFVNPGEAEIFLDWISDKLQQPGKRSWAACMVTDGVQGVGRSWLAAALKSTVREAEVTERTMDQVLGIGDGGRFNRWQVGKQFVVVHETREFSDGREFYRAEQHMKTLIDPEPRRISVQEKGQAASDELIFWNLLAFSNHLDALYLSPDDRRWAVFRNRDEVLGADYYSKLYDPGFVRAFGRAFYRWCVAREIGETYDRSRPPVTNAKEHMIQMSCSDRETIWNFVKENAPGVLIWKDLLTRLVDEAFNLLVISPEVEADRDKLIQTFWKRRLFRLSDREEGRRSRAMNRHKTARTNDRAHEVRSFANSKKWKDATNKQLQDEIVQILGVLDSPKRTNVIKFPQ